MMDMLELFDAKIEASKVRPTDVVAWWMVASYFGPLSALNLKKDPESATSQKASA